MASLLCVLLGRLHAVNTIVVPLLIHAHSLFGLAIRTQLDRFTAEFCWPNTVMARPWFKRWWTKYVPQPIERSTYCLLSNLAKSCWSLRSCLQSAEVVFPAASLTRTCAAEADAIAVTWESADWRVADYVCVRNQQEG